MRKELETKDQLVKTLRLDLQGKSTELEQLTNNTNQQIQTLVNELDESKNSFKHLTKR
jgi:hypothetical protein